MPSIVDRSNTEPDAVDELQLHLGGLDSTDGLHPQWGDFDLCPGDEVIISIHDDQISDPPVERRGLSKEECESNKKEYIRGLFVGT